MNGLSIHARIARAVLAAVKGDADLREYFGGRIGLAEHEQIVENDSLIPPALYVIPQSFADVVADGLRVLETTVVLAYIKAPVKPAAHFLEVLERTETAAKVLAVLQKNGGALYEDGRALTQALLRFEQGPLAGKLAGGLLLTPIRVTFTSLPDRRITE